MEVEEILWMVVDGKEVLGVLKIEYKDLYEEGVNIENENGFG
ncbi:hypothetical protein [Bacillus sp. WP8]|nr:hypothetical protein [Bacillus sp. WP8]